MMYRFVCLIVICLLQMPAFATALEAEGDLIGTPKRYIIHEKDNLYAIARRFDVGIVELLAANPRTDPWMPPAGKRLTIPTMHVLPKAERMGIVINLSELRLFYYAEDGQVYTFPIGIGRQNWETPLGTTEIIRKRVHPTWTPPASIREEDPELPDIVPAGPDNPLGDYALDLDLSGILIHGTNRPYGVGKRSSHGCIRLYPEDIETLFNLVDVGTQVTIIDTPFKLGWKEDRLFLEVTPNQMQTDIIAKYGKPQALQISELYEAVLEAAGESVTIDWQLVDKATRSHNGIPVVIGERH